MTKRILTQNELKTILNYNPETGIFTWLKPTSNRVKVGMEAGTIMPIGYISINILNKIYYSHRLAFLYMTGSWPKEQVDHINMDKLDNRWCNLREVNKSQNMQNRGKQLNNKSGYKGVHEDKRKKLTRWIAKCKINGVIYNLGGYPTPELASEVYENFTKIHYGEFYRE